MVIIKSHNKFKHQNPCYIICSDEIIPKDYFSNLPVFFTDHNVMEDLYALSQCELIIGPSSTFSIWASFYGITASGSQRLISLYFINLQPSELMKIAIIICFSKYYHRIQIYNVNNF